ncbi:unnamed protein product [Protopolystoma xenopodis]|uniref:Uncharacterized protein n=1 Tax=Protopolystoma xenopodis TaxID=117903 RepID=A0A3S5CE91_9PLAT|nr:unnamed protein product [Protopolystoma xenopodis]
MEESSPDRPPSPPCLSVSTLYSLSFASDTSSSACLLSVTLSEGVRSLSCCLPLRPSIDSSTPNSVKSRLDDATRPRRSCLCTQAFLACVVLSHDNGVCLLS